ncbi:Recombination protein RecR [Desulfovibrionales bacterium]
MAALPAPLEAVVVRLGELPGIGPKSALRIALALLKWPEARTRGLGEAILRLRKELFICSRCNGLADAEPCRLCDDPSRSRDILCLVADWDSLLALDRGGFYRGQYIILGGHFTPIDGTNSQSLKVERLRSRLAEGEVQELVLGLGATLEAEHTASYLRNLTAQEFPKIKVTRLAQGIPLGAEIRYMDRETLRQSLTHRQKI